MLERYNLYFETEDGKIIPELPEWWVKSTIVARSNDELDAIELLEDEFWIMISKLKQKAKWMLLPVEGIPLPVLVKQASSGDWVRCENQPKKM